MQSFVEWVNICQLKKYQWTEKCIFGFSYLTLWKHHNSRQPFTIPINLSLLNHSNLFLWMPKIYIYHSLLQQGTLQCNGLIMVPILLSANQSSLSTSHPYQPHLHTMASHTHRGKSNSRRFTRKGPVVQPGDTPGEKQVSEAFISLWWISHSGWIHMFSRRRSPFKLYLCSIELLNLNEIYIRNSPHCHQSHCSWAKHRACKHELPLKI